MSLTGCLSDLKAAGIELHPDDRKKVFALSRKYHRGGMDSDAAALKAATEVHAEAESSAGASAAPAPKLYKLRGMAERAKRELGNQHRIQKVKGGYILRLASDKEAKAAQKAGRRAQRGADPSRDSLLTALAREGGINRESARKDLGVPNDYFGTRGRGTILPVFPAEGGKLAEQAVERLIEDGYLPAGAGLHSLEDKLNAEFDGKPQFSVQYELEEANLSDEELDARRAAFEAEQQEALQDFTPDDLEDAGYIDADPEVQSAIEALLVQARAGGIDIEALQEDAARATEGQSQREYDSDLKARLEAALAGAAAEAGPLEPGAAQPSDQGDGGAAGEVAPQGLTPPTPESLRADAERAAAAEAADRAEQKRLADKAAADAERGEFVLTGSNRPADVGAAAGQQDIFGAPPPPPPPPPATKAAPGDSDAVKQAKADLMAGLGDLANLLSKGARKNITPEDEQKLLPVLTRVFDAAFRLGYLKFKEAAKFVLDQIRAALGDEAADAITLDHLQGAYITMAGRYKEQGASSKRDVVAVDDKAEIEAHNGGDVRNAPANLEPDRGAAAAADAAVAPDVQAPPDSTVWSDGVPGSATGGEGRGQPDLFGVPDDRAAASGERGDQPIRGDEREAGPAEFSDRGSDGERGDSPGVDGVPPDGIPAGEVAAAADDRRSDVTKRAAQRAAESIAVKPGDIDNIRETLPYLLPEQQDDVLKAEQRFAKPDGYGMLFTNGTGTGKTFTGLGMVKRAAKQGKTNQIIVVPDAKIMADWVLSGQAMGLDIIALNSTRDAGRGIVITTYANFGDNDELARRKWDFVIADEAHQLMQSADGKQTKALDALRALTMHPRGAHDRYAMLNREDIAKRKDLSDRITANGKIMALDDTTEMQITSLKRENVRLEAEFKALDTKLNKARDAVVAEVQASQGAARPRVGFLSATPFAYEKTVDWADGFLFDYAEGYPHDPTSLSYNQPDAHDYFFITHFGYSMRVNKLTEPGPNVDRGLLQRQFNSWLKKRGALSGRQLEVDADYDRKFQLVESAVGTQIDQALQFVEDQRRATAEAQKDDRTAINPWDAIQGELNDSFYGPLGHLVRRYLLEAIKAKEVVPLIREHLAMGRKVVVFHDFKKGGSTNPFSFEDEPVVDKAATSMSAAEYTLYVRRLTARNAAAAEFRAKFPALSGGELLRGLVSPIARFKQAFPDVLLINGDEKPRDLLERYKAIQDDSTGPLVALVQSDKNKGWSGHDTSGKYPRVLFNLGLPTQPTKTIQQEGRIYRTGQVSNAMFRYLNTGTNWERWAFATTIAERASAAENLGSGELARALRDAFISGFEESGDFPAGHEGEGTGGKARDRLANNAVSAYDRAKAFYWGTQKKNSKTKAQEGKDYFATPEPLGLKIVEWLDVRGGEDALEPSAGHGAIARWFSETTKRTAIEPSSQLASRLAMVFDGKIIQGDFEDLHVVNKFDAIGMNPPYGTAGRTAVDHLAKAATHLREGGRVIAILPDGPSSNAKFDKFFAGEDQMRPSRPVFQSKAGPVHEGDKLTWNIFGHAGQDATGTFVKRHSDGRVTASRGEYESTFWENQIVKVEAGPRTEAYNPAAGLHLTGTVTLPGVTFERAGTGVRTRIVIIDKLAPDERANPGQRDIDLSDAKDINELFDRLENIDFPKRLKVEREEAVPAAQVRADAKAQNKSDKKEAQAKGEDAAKAAGLETEEYVTQKGKTIVGVIAKHLDHGQAREIDPYTWRRNGGFFIRAEHVPALLAKYPPPPSVAREEQAIYAVNDPSANYDLFPDDMPTAPATSVAPAIKPNVVAIRQDMHMPGVYHVSSQLVEVGKREVPFRRVTTWQEAASALAAMGRYAVEHFDVLITDKAGKPLAVVGAFKGAQSQAAVYPATVLGEALRIEGAANAWGVHNHPSGLSELSRADEHLSSIFGATFEPSGVRWRGLAALGDQKFTAVDRDGTTFTTDALIEGPGAAAVPVVERTITRAAPDLPTLDSPQRAKDVAAQLSNGQPGIIFGDGQNKVTAWVPITDIPGMAALRKDGRFNRLINAATQAGAGAAVIVNPNGVMPKDTLDNIASALKLADVRTLDVIDPVTRESAAERGADPFASKTVFSRAAQTTTAAFKRWFGDSKVVDEQGKPLVVYRGHNTDSGPIIRTIKGGYFTRDPELASFYASSQLLPEETERAANVLPVYLSIKNPLVIKDNSFWTKLRSVLKTGRMPLRPLESSIAMYLTPEKIAEYEAQGYDGIINGPWNEIIAFHPEQIKSAIGNTGAFDPTNPNIAFSRAAFFSALERQVEATKINAAPAAGWKDAIKGLIAAGKVKAAEVEWSGLNEWLDLQQGKVTKQQVSEFLAANGVKVTETVLGAQLSRDEYLRRLNAMTREELADHYEEEMSLDPVDEYGERWKESQLVDDLLEAPLDAMPGEAGTDDTKYSTYTLPGGTNYREVLLTLPEVPTEAGRALKALQANISRRVGRERWGAEVMTDAEIDEYDRLNDESGRSAGRAPPQFTSGHWDQPNVLAHVRLNDRTDADGKRVLFVEELQSDWGQSGARKEDTGPAKGLRRGFKGDDLPYDVRQSDIGTGNWEVYDKRTGVAQYGMPHSTKERADAVAAQSNETHESLRPPRGPFVEKTDAWVALALKRIIKMAVDEGYDRVAFVNGDQSAQRYDLSKQISTVRLTTDDKGGTLKNAIFNAVRISDGRAINRIINTAQELEDVIGKDLAGKLLNTEPKKGTGGNAGAWVREISGLDLKVGGEGMRAFYDKIVPAVAKDVLRKVGGGQLGEVDLPRTNERGHPFIGGLPLRQLGFDITDKMRAFAAEGMPLFSRSPAPQGVSLQAAQTAVAAIRQANPTAPPIHVHDTIEDAPKSLRDEIEAAGGAPVEGAYHEGAIHVFPQNIDSIDRLMFVVGHHEIRHHGMRALLGNRYGPVMLSMWQSNPALREAAEAKIADGVTRDKLTATEEALADMPADVLAGLTGWDKIVAAVRNWLRGVADSLREQGFDAMADLIEPARWTDADVAHFVSRAEDVSRGGEQGGKQTFLSTAFQRVWHGTPHRGIERFDIDKVGTGEGTAAFGHGLYFASKREVSDFYRQSLAGGGTKIADEAKRLGLDMTPDALHAVGVQAWTNADDRTAARRAQYMSRDARALELDALQQLVRDWREKQQGQLYQVEIPENDELLDYNKTVAEQPAGVREHLAALGFPAEQVIVRDASGKTLGTFDTSEAARRAITVGNLAGTPKRVPNKTTGREVYAELKKREGSAAAASKALQDAGIPGLRYLDQYSRASQNEADRSYNYVIFDDARAEITAALFSRNTVAQGRIRRSIAELVQHAEDNVAWRDWYDMHRAAVEGAFGEDAELFQRILSATSQLQTVKGNVTMALRAYEMMLSGEPFRGFLPAVRSNLERIRQDQGLNGPKISEFERGNLGADDAIAVDRHIAQLLFNTSSPTAAQIRAAKKRIRLVAEALGWTPKQAQAALWAANQVRKGIDPTKVVSYDRVLEQRADVIREIRARYGRGDGLPAGGRTAAPSGAVFSRAGGRRQGVAQALRNAGGGEQITGDTGRAYTPEVRRAMRNVGMIVDRPTLEQRMKALWQDAGQRLAQGVFDQFAPVKEMSREAYGLLRLSKGASGAFETLLKGGKLKLEEGVYDFDAQDRGGVVDKLLIPLQGEHHDFFRWVAAKRAERLMGEGKEHLFSPEDIDALKSLSDGTTSFDYTLQHGARAGQVTRDRTLIYPDALATFNTFNKNVLDMAEQSGLIDAESRHLWEHEFYVPFYRVADEDGGIRGMNVKSGVVRQQAFKRLKGGRQALNPDLLDNTLMNWAHLIDAAAKNRAAKATLETAERLGRAIEAPESTAREMANAMGKRDNVVWFVDKGRKRYFVVEDQPLLAAVSSLEYAGLRGPVMDAMSTFKHALTVGVTASPFFKIRNLIRDSVQAIGTAPLGANPLTNVAQGWNLTDPRSDPYFRLLASGGTIHFGTMLEGSEAKRVQALVESGVDSATILNSDRKVKAFYRHYIEPAITAYNELGNRGEAVNRAALYAQLRSQGIGHAEATLAARDLMDFSMQGSFTSIRFLAQVVPFLNARIQGLYKLGRAAKEDPARFSAVIGASAMLSIGLLLAFSDDDDWKKREDWDRNNFWWFKFGGTAFRIPKPFEIGAIATLAERGFELAFEQEMTSKRFREQLLNLLSDNLSLNPVPQMVKPILDAYANRDSYTGRPIETSGMERLRPEYRFTESTSMAARALSTGLNELTRPIGIDSASPMKVDHLLRGYFGWLGTFVVQAGDVLARPATDQPTRPDSDIWKAATGGMVSDLRDAPSRYVSQMYEQAKEVEQAYGTWKSLVREGKIAEAGEFFDENRPLIGAHRGIERVKRNEAELNRRIRATEKGDLSGEEKRERIRELLRQRDQVARVVPGP